jgi:hypothetical protein
MKQTMKQRFYKPVLMILCMAALLFGLSTCGDPGTGAYVMGSEALLTSLTISGITATAPAQIDSRTWDNLDIDLGSEQFKTMTFLLNRHMDGVYINPQASVNARIAFGKGDQFNRPSVFYDYRTPLRDFNANDFLYIRVTSENTTVTNYYRFYLRVYNAVTHLADVYIVDKRAEVLEGGETPALAEEGNISITTADSKDRGKLRAIGFSETSSFQFARIPDKSTDEPEFKTLSSRTVQEGIKPKDKPEDPDIPNMVTYYTMTEDFLDQDLFFVKVIAQNTVDFAIYKFRVSVARISTIKTLKMVDAGNVGHEVMGKGVPDAAWLSARPGGFETADQPNDGFGISIELDDPMATYEYVAIANPTAGLPGSFTGNRDNPIKVKFDNTNALAIKVTSENTRAVMYYKIKVELLAARFEIHPVSRVYYYYRDPAIAGPINAAAGAAIDYPSPLLEVVEEDEDGEITVTYETWDSDVPQPLTFKLDRTVPGATYQWYEANSWYGGYGFDPDGNIGYVNEDSATIWETAFNGAGGYPDPFDRYHAKQFDEKKNPSLFNGGNQGPPHYVLPGRPILGATGMSYTPEITFRPFITGFSSESHYYWVVVTAPSGYKVTSGRAVIVSERDKNKKHHLIDVNNDYKGADGIPLPFKNIQPFQKKYDYFRIPLTFPAKDPQDPSRDYDFLDYSIMYIQAKFYLADGTPWIQNWTNGNVAFEDNTEKEPTDQYSKDGNVIVLYYNLTNNNATYMMDGDAKEPQAGADLRAIPTHVVISPSGDHTKGETKDGYPPLAPSGVDSIDFAVAGPSIVGTDLQGWFCGFIELVELRFEGPPRSN